MQNRKVAITLTMPQNIIRELHYYVNPRGISGFVTKLVEQGLAQKREALAADFRESAADTERNDEIAEWDALVGDGLDEADGY